MELQNFYTIAYAQDSSNDMWSMVIQILIPLAALFGPWLTYVIAKRKLGGDLVLADISAVKEWSNQRKAFENEILELHNGLMEEQDRRRKDREMYTSMIDQISSELDQIRAEFEACKRLLGM